MNFCEPARSACPGRGATSLRELASGSDDETLRLWRAADGKPLHTVSAADSLVRGGWVGAVAFNPDGKTVVANTPRGGLQFYASRTGKRAAGHAPLKDAAYGVAFSPDGKRLAVGHKETVTIWEKGKKKPTAILKDYDRVPENLKVVERVVRGGNLHG